MKSVALAVLLALAGVARAAVPIESRTAKVDGLTIHYLVAGKGEPLLLLHGYAQSSLMWRAAMPELAKRFTVIAPDLPAFGASAVPGGGLDMKFAAVRIHALAKQLGVTKARIVGHDIGLMVAYAYAAMYPTEVDKLVLLDAFLPGIGNWESAYHDPHLWHLIFLGSTPEALVAGRERIYLDHFWNDLAADPARSVSEANRKQYTADYARPGRIHAGWAYFATIPQTADAFAELAKTKLAIPVLAVAGEKGAGSLLGEQAKLVATDVTSVVMPNTGHWLIDERPAETLAALQHFL